MVENKKNYDILKAVWGTICVLMERMFIYGAKKRMAYL